jgi:CheY-like chemotaxis protein
MNLVLLVDDSPHAQRIGERILSEEGYEVVTVSNADTAFVRLEDADPDVVIADTVMPGRTGYEICQYIKVNPRFRHVRVILTAGVLEPLDEAQVKRVEADGTLKKPFEASLLVNAVKPLAEAARADRDRSKNGGAASAKAPAVPAPAPFVAVVEPDQVRAAVTVALDASMETMIEEITRRVMVALQAKPQAKGEESSVPAPVAPVPPAVAPAAVTAAVVAAAPVVATAPVVVTAPVESAPPAPVMPAPFAPVQPEPVRRVSPLRLRPSTSILGLDPFPPDPETPPDSQS